MDHRKRDSFNVFRRREELAAQAARAIQDGLPMKLSPSQLDVDSLSAIGAQVCTLLLERNYGELASRFGYALAHGLEPAVIIEADFLTAANSPYDGKQGDQQPVVVRYFKPNTTKLFAEVECTVYVRSAAYVGLCLIVAGTADDMHISIEHIYGDEQTEP